MPLDHPSARSRDPGHQVAWVIPQFITSMHAVSLSTTSRMIVSRSGSDTTSRRPAPKAPAGSALVQIVGWEGDFHAAKSGRLPYKRIFKARCRKLPLLSPVSEPRHTNSAVGLQTGEGAARSFRRRIALTSVKLQATVCQ
jgi:hypothetical protein